MYTGLTADEIRIAGHNGDEINAYFASPHGDGPFPGVAVIHHMPGWDESTTEIANRFAAHGYLAIVANLHFRDGPEASPDDAAAASRASGGVPDERFLGDLAAAVAYVRAHELSNQKVGVIGYCSGGRQAFLAACSLDIDAGVDCYGAFVARKLPEGAPMKLTPVIDLAENMACPLLGLFGLDDQFPSSEEVDEIDAELTRLGKDHEFHRYEGAGHAFFNTARDSYRPAAATDGWERIFDFYGRHLVS
jgi:carboxymethylenebutenolidase